MNWKQPPIIKIYEALGAVADGRVLVDGNKAKVYSSSGNKYYDVAYDAEKGAIMANDNGSYWKGYVGYPAIAYLMATGVLLYKSELGNLLKGIAWKDINQKFKNDFDATLAFILAEKSEQEREGLAAYAEQVQQELAQFNLSLLGKKQLPPEGY
ncbi:MAG: hypothetical protein A2542_01560 [Parcubacteria group bacterium RIFOXYD2_FULL_52_8]|nr:MAG: hypothetical protein A2542_01560 [Parcubacteria group bacterium RIFOXYD2_FULL_52_8]